MRSRLPTPRVALWCGLVTVGCLGSAGPGPECASLRPINDAVRGDGISEAQRTCLQARLDDPGDPQRRAVSELLLFDARAQDEDGSAWAPRAEAHVETFPADVVTFVHLANYHQRRGPEGAERSLRFAQRGLSQLQRHPAQTPSEKRAFHDLMKARAVAADMLAPPSAGPETRVRTAKYARDWHIAAKALSLPTERPLAMCTNAGGDEAYCRGQSGAPAPPTAEP